MPEGNTKFVNSLYLKNLIENNFGESEVKVKEYSVEPASREGELIGRSSMNRILVRYTSRETPSGGSLSLVVKMKPTKGDLAILCQNSDAFAKEHSVYKKIIPAITDQLKKIAGKIEMVPELIYSSEVPIDILVFEDLTLRGYNTENPLTGLNYEQSKMALEKLAFFHAASVALYESNPNEIDEKFSKGTFHADYKDGLKYFVDVIKELISNANNLQIDGKIKEKLATLPPKVISKGIEVYSKNKSGFNVLNHGDFWTSNILFKYENGQLVDALFVDFQNSVYGSPVIDLFYFLTTSVACDVLATSRDELIFIYYETLKLVLDKLEYKGYVPTLNELQVEILRKGALEVIFSLTTGPFLRCGAKTVPAIQPAFYKDDLDKAEVKKVFEEVKYGLKNQLKMFEDKGLLDWGSADGKVRGLMGRFQR